MIKNNSHKLWNYLFVLTATIMFLTNATQPWHAVSAQDIPINDSEIKPPENLEIEYVNPYFSIEHRTQEDGTELDGFIINSPPKPPKKIEAERAASIEPISSATTLVDFPSFDWVFGCAAVSGAMAAAYYDRNGFPNVYTGPTNGGVMPNTDTSWPTWYDGYEYYPNNPLVASQAGLDGRPSSQRGSIEDYWVKYDSTADDPFITNGWTQHSWGTAVGDYMKTSQSSYNNTDGSTWTYTYNNLSDRLTCTEMENQNIDHMDGTYGMKLFFEARGYSVTTCYNQKTDNKISGGFSLADYQAEINAGHPVLISLTGHKVVGYGYSGSTIYIRDTWDSNPNNTYTMPWGGFYASPAGNLELLSVSVIHLAPVTTNHTLSVNKSGNGSGMVTSNPAGINCGSTCQANFNNGLSVTLTATPDPGSTFNSWSGCDSASGNTCQVTLSNARSITATFTLSAPATFQLTVAKNGTGSGMVTSNPAGIDCGSTCSASFSNSTSVTLTASPDPASVFSAWSGCDSASGYQCTVNMNQARTVTATFDLAAPTDYFLTIAKNGFGTGTVTSNPMGINCGSTCNAAFTQGTLVTLTANPDMGSSFFGWSGACSGTSSTCIVTMSQDINVTATFDAPIQLSFNDVPSSHWAYDWIYRLYNAGITSGCASNPLRYCPDQIVNRAQMAIFLLKGRYGPNYTPPPVGSSTGFNDVPTNHWAAAWIKQLAAEGITAGCGSGNYCPDAPVTRAQMAIFLLRAKYGSSFTPQTPIPPFNMIEDPGFETNTPNLFWMEYSSNFGTPLCTPGTCSDSLGAIGPHTGTGWVWFGGTTANEYAYVEQSFFIPSIASNLQFYLWIGRADNMSGVDDYLKVEIDGVQIFRADATQKSSYSSYQQVNVDISSYKDNDFHTLSFISETDGQIVNFNLDDVSIYNSETTPPTFTDVPETHWAYAWIEALYMEGVTSGVAQGLYGPAQSVTRAQMAVFLVRTFNLP